MLRAALIEGGIRIRTCSCDLSEKYNESIVITDCSRIIASTSIFAVVSVNFSDIVGSYVEGKIMQEKTNKQLGTKTVPVPHLFPA